MPRKAKAKKAAKRKTKPRAKRTKQKGRVKRSRKATGKRVRGGGFNFGRVFGKTLTGAAEGAEQTQRFGPVGMALGAAHGLAHGLAGGIVNEFGHEYHLGGY